MNNKGWIKLHRKVFESELWLQKPWSWKLIWIYILGNVNHEAGGGFERGEGFFNFSTERNLIDRDISEDMIKKFLVFSRKNEMLSTKRSTRGTRVKVLKYHIYQMDDSDRGTKESTREARQKHDRSTPINKNGRMEEERKNTSDETSPADPIKFVWGDYIKKMEDDPRRHINIVALYLEEKKPKILSVEQMRVAVRRHLRPAKDLAPFTDKQILDAIPQAKRLTKEWTLETIIKVLTK